MSVCIDQHQIEIERNAEAWNQKPQLQKIYREFYEEITRSLKPSLPGSILEIGSGIGNLKQAVPGVICSDLFQHAWLDLTCDTYALPFRSGSLSHLVLFDVFHHLECPGLFFEEAARVLTKEGRVILFEPYISFSSRFIYGLFHHEPIAWKDEIDLTTDRQVFPESYYAAQGNATRLFFHDRQDAWPEKWTLIECRAFACFRYLLSGGFSRPCVYPQFCYPSMVRLDRLLSRWPGLFGGRCLVVLQRT